MKDVPDAMARILDGPTLTGVLERMGAVVKAQTGVQNFVFEQQKKMAIQTT